MGGQSTALGNARTRIRSDVSTAAKNTRTRTVGRGVTAVPEKTVMQMLEGYAGICAACFEPIRTGEEFRFRPGGRKFHSRCVMSKPDNYYVKLEKRKARN